MIQDKTGKTPKWVWRFLLSVWSKETEIPRPGLTRDFMMTDEGNYRPQDAWMVHMRFKEKNR